MSKTKKILYAALAIIIIAQFFGPKKNLGDQTKVNAFFEETNPSEAVKLVLKESCFDCHSNYTEYPVYNSITPVNYYLAHHINEAKEHLNFSEWDSYSDKRKKRKIEEIGESVEEGWMPLNSYLWLHPHAKLKPEQVVAVNDWVTFMQVNYNMGQNPQ